MRDGTYENVSNWRFNSFKIDDKSCIKFYYYAQNGKVELEKVCGSIRNIKNLMRSWKTKYGWSKGWKNVKYIDIATGEN